MLKDGVEAMTTIELMVVRSGLGEHLAFDGRVEGALEVDVRSNVSDGSGSGAYERSEDNVLEHSAKESRAAGGVIPRKGGC